MLSHSVYDDAMNATVTSSQRRKIWLRRRYHPSPSEDRICRTPGAVDWVEPG